MLGGCCEGEKVPETEAFRGKFIDFTNKFNSLFPSHQQQPRSFFLSFPAAASLQPAPSTFTHSRRLPVELDSIMDDVLEGFPFVICWKFYKKPKE